MGSYNRVVMPRESLLNKHFCSYSIFDDTYDIIDVMQVTFVTCY
jgi:hypothetical protein